MMAAYQPQPGAMHPGMAPHGHPGMAQGQPITAAQMPQMGHPGAVTPGPHVSQPGAMMAMQPGANAMGGPAAMGGQPPVAQMGGMPPQMGGQSMAGGAPNAHALSMNPQAAAMQHQHMMQQHLQANPQFMQQQQQAMLQRRAMMQANGLVQQGGLQALSPQQIAQLQQNSVAMQSQLPQLPQHLHAQQMMLQQQRAQQQQAQVAHNQQLQQQQLALQQAQNNVSAAQPPVQNPQAGQHQHPGQPMRPQSRTANANDQTPGGSQQSAQGQANAQSGQGQQQQQQQQQQQTPGQSNQQPAQQPNMQQPGQQQPAMTPQQMQAIQQQQRQRQLQMQQHNALQRQMQAQQQAQQQQSGQGGVFILKVVQFMDHLGSIDGNNGKDIANWHNFVDRHFAPDARFTHAFAPPPGADDPARIKRYEVPRATIARYFQTYFDSKADSLRLHLEKVRETPMPPNRHQVSFESAILAVSYPNGARLEMKGTLQVLFAPGSDNIELMELYTQSTEEHVNRSEIERVLSNWSPSMANKTSPKMAKNKLPKAQQKMQSQYDGLTINDFPRVATGKLGITSRVQQFLELDETMCVMADLIALAQERKLRPEQALDTIVAHYESQGGVAAMQQQANPPFNFPPNGIAMGQRTPSMQNMQMPNAPPQFSSPSVSHLNLPMQNGIMNGSPHIGNHVGGLVPNLNMANSHTPSPHQSNMAAPAMMPQHSQQGTSSSAASANTSPNQNNKRRRSQVKMEGVDDGGSGADGGRVKPSPRMPKKAKPGS